MFLLLKLFFRSAKAFFYLKQKLIRENLLLKHENEILKRQNNKRLIFTDQHKKYLVILNLFYNIKNEISLIKPSTLLKWQRELIKNHWRFPNKRRPCGRPPIKKEIKDLVLRLKNDNLTWGIKKIQGELLKLNISLDTKTIRNILKDFYKRGKIKRSLTWRRFLKMQAKSIYAMDFFTVDTILKQRFYVYFIIHHQTRKIIQFAITQYPTKEFVRQQIIEFSEKLNSVIYLIRDNGSMFNINYRAFNIREIRTAIAAPKMNAFAERLVRSVRTEALDHYLIFYEKQIKNILTEYFEYYNNKRPHQGIEQKIPNGYSPQEKGKVVSYPILGGLYHHYERKTA